MTFYYGPQAADRRRRGVAQAILAQARTPRILRNSRFRRVNWPTAGSWCRKLIVLLGWAKSNNEARRAIEGGGVNIGPEKEKIADPKAHDSGDGWVDRAVGEPAHCQAASPIDTVWKGC